MLIVPKHSSWLLWFAAIMLALAVFVGFPQYPAHAASRAPLTYHNPCWESTCNGTDPYAIGCAGVTGAHWGVLLSTYIRDSSNTIIGYVQLWYSNSCDTNWARTVAYNPGYVTADVGPYNNGNGQALESNACLSLPSCTDLRTYQHWIPGPAYALGRINGYTNEVHQ